MQVGRGIRLKNSFAPLSDDDDTGREEERKERVGAVGSREESRWMWRKKSPVADTGCSRHLIGGDLEDSIVSRRPCEFRCEEASGGEMVCAEEVEASPLLEGVDGEPVCPLLRGAFKSLIPVSLLSVRGCRIQKVDPPFWVEFPGKGGGAVRARLYERDRVHVVRVLSPSSSSPPSESYLSADRKDCVYLTIVSDFSSFVSSGTDEAARERMPDKAKLSVSWAQQCTEHMSPAELNLWYGRFGHTTGRRLYACFREKGMAHRVTVEECRKGIDCRECREVNAEMRRIPARQGGGVPERLGSHWT
uniref:GAG-pre-integrase domain-containing protein n=1 Tax=Chromera velia CCMP2878 TaxID=1169474 RepID=A0A0G4HD68_9ALVE|eukprot:Cvel_26438.t1-p1 / transcript=Cvel_26438.t1 / gene=Cvel_26438 / organism=Chromera_velia_CCMP2878 / gene_product=hypothetical protein / transcript_product=hypothetical protein / location=Cvel_scaffold3141:15447-16355(-) / protein_length=303 / sequence_SO=supercontig / SO=protein_coding / is_pseudo=false